MAEFCFECYKKYFDENVKKEDLVIDKYYELCEGCGQSKQTVAKVREFYIPKFLLRLFERYK